jgi:magnesium chelatase subunit I
MRDDMPDDAKTETAAAAAPAPAPAPALALAPAPALALTPAPAPAHRRARPPFPFSAIVGQIEMKRALTLAAIDPAIGGVLALGDRRAGKSTAVRGLAALLPPIVRVTGCACNRPPPKAPRACASAAARTRRSRRNRRPPR